MNPTIEKIVNLLFEDLEETEETSALHEEVLNNCQERFSDLVENGMTADEATGAVIESLKGMEDALRDYPRKARPAEPARGEQTDYQFCSSGIRRISMQLMHEDVVCELSPDDAIHVKVPSSVQVSHQGDQLLIRHERKLSGFSVNFRLSSFSFSFSSDTVRLLLPEALLTDTEIQTASGNAEWLKAPAERLHITTASGDVRVEDAALHAAEIHTVSGDVEMTNISAERVQIHTASGGVSCRKCRLADAFQAVSASGDLFWSGECPRVQLSSVSGDARCQGLCERIQCRTTSGDVSLTASHAVQRLTGQTVSGDARFALPAGLQPQLRCRSLLGELCSHVTSDPSSPVVIEWTATSGDITIEEQA